MIIESLGFFLVHSILLLNSRGGMRQDPSTSTEHKIIFGDSREMCEIEDESVHLVVTSPPYPMIEIWDSFFESVGCSSYEEMHEYLRPAWSEIKRVLIPGGIACTSIGDAARTEDGLFRLYTNHARIINEFEDLDFVTLPNILWKKPTTKPKYKGKGAFLGSGFLPPSAYVTLDCEYILFFRKGKPREFTPHDEKRYESKYTKEERDSWFTQIWEITGARQNQKGVNRRIAAFPEEIPYRLTRMFSIKGDTILDPFLGIGTTIKVAIRTGRNSIGYEIDESLEPVIKKKIGYDQQRLGDFSANIEIVKRH